MFSDFNKMALHFFKRVGISQSPTFASPTTHIRTFALSQTYFGRSLDPIIKRQQMDRYNERRRNRRRTDPEYAAKELKGYRERPPHENWGFRNRELALEAKRMAHMRRKAEDPLYTLRTRIRTTLATHSWMRESLPWKTHVPVLYEDKVEHNCGKCLVSRHGGLKFWWQERQDTSKFLCHKCYFTGPESMPEGYEDCTKTSEITARAGIKS
ncbi:hypothetical protein D6C86_06451 [Aureobasidium pullulans]|nr:hypothetical protein D6C86_06451 [Aureobasidium pullulans]